MNTWYVPIVENSQMNTLPSPQSSEDLISIVHLNQDRSFKSRRRQTAMVSWCSLPACPILNWQIKIEWKRSVSQKLCDGTRWGELTCGHNAALLWLYSLFEVIRVIVETNTTENPDMSFCTDRSKATIHLVALKVCIMCQTCVYRSNFQLSIRGLSI